MADPGSESSYGGVPLARAVAAFRAQGRMDLAFGGPVLPGGSGLQITELCGARTRALANLTVRSGAGLGGKSLVLARPAWVNRYQSAQGITHVYDRAVGREGLETVAALPIVVGRRPRVVIYIAHRSPVGLGDRWLDGLLPLIRRLERDIAVDDEVRRRLGAAQQLTAEPPGLSRADALDISRELADLAALISDEALRARLDAVRARLADVGERPRRAGQVRLAPRECEVLAQVALGYTNQQIAENLGLLPNTVKSYLKSAMRKLHARNRVQAVTAARAAGVIG